MADFPIDIPFSASEPASNAPAYLSESQSLKTIAASTGAQRWEFALTTGLLQDADLRKAWAFLNAHGSHKPFDVALPIHSKPLGLVSGAVTATAAHAIGANAVTFANYSPQIGDFFRFACHAKMYQAEGASGNTATIYPPLLQAVTLNEAVTVTDVKFTVRVPGKISKFKIDAKKMAKLKFKCIEVF